MTVVVLSDNKGLYDAVSRELGLYTSVEFRTWEENSRGVGRTAAVIPKVIVADFPSVRGQSLQERLGELKRVSMGSLVVCLSADVEADSEARTIIGAEAIVVRKPLPVAQLNLLIEKRMGAGRRAWTQRLDARLIARAAATPAAALVGGLFAWEAVVRLFGIPRYLLPAPSVIGASVLGNWSALLTAAIESSQAAVLGFLLAGLVGIGVGILFSQSKLLEEGLFPYFVIVQSTPVVAVAPLIIIWFGTGLMGKVVMAAIVCLFPMVVNTATGLRSVPQEIRDLMVLHNASKVQALRKGTLPNALPHIFAGFRISATLSVIGAIVAELITADRGLGKILMVSSFRLDTPQLFGSVAASAALGVAFFSVIRAIERRLVFWI